MTMIKYQPLLESLQLLASLRAVGQAIGAGAVKRAMKALIMATGYLRLDGIHVSCVPEFAEVTIDDKVRTVVLLAMSFAFVYLRVQSA